MSASAVPPFMAPVRSARLTRTLLFAIAAMSLVAVVSGFAQLNLFSRVVNGEAVSESEALANDVRQGIIGLLQVAFFLATTVSFPIWSYNVHKNLPALGSSRLKYTPGWAAGGFFVPVLNLVRPFQVMREVWHGSNPASVETESDSPFSMSGIERADTTPALVGWWWALFVISNVAGNVTGRLAFKADPSLAELQAMTWSQIASDALDVPSALVAATLVGTIHRWQAQRFDTLRMGVISGE